MANTIQFKRGAAADIPALGVGEPGFCTDTYAFYIGSAAGNKIIGSEENFTTILKNKLDAIEALADVTDFTNVAAALGAATGAIAVNSQKITGLADPTEAQDAATKAYADAIAGGIDPKDSVRVATAAVLPANTASGSGVGKTLTMNAAAVLTVDGVATVLNDRILVKDEATGANNGVYKVTTEGTGAVAAVLTRAIDFDADAEVTGGAYCFVEEGTANADEGWILTTNDPITVDTTALVFSQFSSATFVDTLNELTDVNITSVGDNEVLQYDSGSSKWINQTLTEAGIQAVLTFGIADTNAVKIDGADIANGEYAKFTANGLQSKTTAEVLSDIGGQASDAGLTSLAGLAYASESFIKMTNTDTYATRTIAETKTDLSLNNVENTALSTALIDGGSFV